jgi:hypothetical protein
MPLQDKSRSDRKVKARKVIGIVNETGEQFCFESIHDMAECFGIVTQTAYNIIRRKQVFRGLTFRYLESEQKGVIQNGAESND